MLFYIGAVVLGILAYLIIGYGIARKGVAIFLGNDESSLASVLFFPVSSVSGYIRSCHEIRGGGDLLLCPRCDELYVLVVTLLWPVKVAVNVCFLLLYPPATVAFARRFATAVWSVLSLPLRETAEVYAKRKKLSDGAPPKEPEQGMDVAVLIRGRDDAVAEMKAARDRANRFAKAIEEKLEQDRILLERAAICDPELGKLLREDGYADDFEERLRTSAKQSVP